MRWPALSLQCLAPYLLVDALLEQVPRAKELLVGRRRRLVAVLEGGELHRAEVVRYLREPVVLRC